MVSRNTSKLIRKFRTCKTMSEANEIFTITWRVKNFSMCPVKLGQHIISPVFRIPEFGNSEWSLWLYPKGNKKKDNVGCYLRNERLGDNKNKKVNLKMCVYPSNERLTENDFGEKDSWGFPALCFMTDLMKEKDTYLPNDTFKVKCSIEFKDLGDSKEMKDKQLRTLARDFLNGKNSYNIKQCHIETTVRVHTKSVTWPIQRFLSLAVNEILVLPVGSAIKEMPSFYVTFYKNAESPPSIEITQKDPLSENLFVKCSVSVVNGPTDVNCCISDEFLFISDEIWYLSHFPKWDELEEKEYFKQTGGTLYIQFDFAFSIDGQMHHIEKFEWYPCIPPFTKHVQAEVLTVPTKNEDQAVVTLRAGDQTFVVLKSVLTARSKVFCAMFENDMKEKKTGVVDIPDVEPNTLGEMIAFLYLGTTTGNHSTSDVIKLYAIGHKYQVMSLMDYCSSILMSSLSASNVCDILEISDLYQNEQLLKCAEDFLISDPDPHQLLLSQDWKNLMEKNGSLAAKIMHKTLVN